MKSKNISIIIPTFNQQVSLMQLYNEINSVVTAENYNYELIFVNDGSTDNSEHILNTIYHSNPEHVKVISFDRSYGKALALRAGFRLAHNDIVITMDADLQDNPVEISRFVEKINAGYDVVSGWRYRRRDSFIKNMSSKVYNRITSSLSGIKLHDYNCGFKAYRHDVTRSLPLSSHLDRYTPILAYAAGYKAIAEIPVHQRHRTQNLTKHKIKRFIYSIIDSVNVFIIASKISHHTVAKALYTPPYTLKKILA